MLPDFPATKDLLNQKLMTRFNEVVKRSTVEAPFYRQHEGDHGTLQREDGSKVELRFETARAGFEVSRDQLPSMSLEQIERVYMDAAAEMASQQMGAYFRAVDEAVAEAGTAVDAKSEEFSFDLFLDILGKMQMEFDERGELIPPTVMLHPNMWKAIKDKVAGWEHNPEYGARHRQLIERKREEWREREGRRKLVD